MCSKISLFLYLKFCASPQFFTIKSIFLQQNMILFHNLKTYVAELL
uniref:Uncharacterized protein n=1 Tax=Arundo donax TaxID=35708 RepID=A0A0A9FTE1_ARUDO